MQLRTLIEGIETLKVDGPVTPDVTGLSYEARRVAPGDVYFALERSGRDGHSEIELAVERGAVAVVCRKNGAMRQRATLIEVADTRAALADVSGKFYGDPGRDLRIIG